MSKDYVMQLEATIENLRRDNQLLKELNAKYKDLEEEIGCPIDVYTKLVYDTPIYDKNGYKGFVNAIKKYEVSGYGKRYVVEVIYFAKEEGAKNVIRAFPLEDYKKTWWLKRDKSE